MAIVTTPNARKLKQLSLRGRFYFYTRNGKVICAKWPRKRGTAKTQAEKDRQDWFGQTQKLIKRIPSDFTIPAIEATAGGPLYPRDMLTQANAARMVAVQMPNGDLYRGVNVVSDVSESLDLISNVPGTMLIRGTNGWIGIMPSQTAANWEWSREDSEIVNADSTSIYAFKGNIIFAGATSHCYGLRAMAGYVSGGEYQMILAQRNGSNEITYINKSNIVTADVTGTYVIGFQIDQIIEDGQEWLIAVGRIDQGDTYAMPISYSQPGIYKCPWFNPGVIRIQSDNPLIGTAVDEPASPNRAPLAAALEF